MKILRNFFYFISSFILSINIVFWAKNDTIKDWLQEQDWLIVNVLSNNWWDSSLLDYILTYIKNSLTWLLTITIIWVFLYLWIKLVLARWNPEEFKKVMSHFVYVAIWIFTVYFAYAAVKLVSWINF